MSSEDGKAPLFDNMRKLINIIDELKDVGVSQYIQLPRIAVLGTQSAGKSSLLESIVGVDFLPRGEGVVTRRPLELRLVHVAPSGDPSSDKPYAEFPKEGKTKYYDFEKVREKIIALTEQIAGKNKGIVDDPITMTVYSTICPDLTLVDLPGITRIALANSDQPKDIERITKSMCQRYARDPRTIILCVVPANQDMSTSDALQMAREEDPEGVRTLGVITKIDIMDKGTNARRMLLGQEIPLKLGFVGVKGRSQLDINTSMKVDNALKIEKDYFASHPVYSTLPPGHVGTEALSQRLTKVLFGHIRNTLPEISREISNKIKECEERLRDLGEPLPSGVKDKMQLLWNIITDFTENFKNNIRGKYDPKRNTKVSGEVSGGAKIKLMYGDLYIEMVEKRATEHMTDDHINKAIVLHQGDSIPGFPSVDSFLYLITPLIKQLKEPAFDLLSSVHLYLESIASQLIDKLFVRFPSIIDDITEIVFQALREEKEVTRELIENIIESEKTYIFTNDIEYMTTRTAFIPVQNQDPRNPQANKPVDPEKLFIDEMRARIDAYFAIVLRNIRDTVPKVIGNFLVKAIQEKMQYTLYNEINRTEALLASVGEPPHITAERETLNKVLGVLRKAKIVLTKDPDLAPTFDNKPESSKPVQQTRQEPERKPVANPFREEPRPEPVQQQQQQVQQPRYPPTNQPPIQQQQPQQPLNRGAPVSNNPYQQQQPGAKPTNNPYAQKGNLFGPGGDDGQKKPGAGLFG